MPHAEVAEPQVMEKRLGLVYLPQGLSGDREAVRKPRGEAGERSLVPCGESKGAGGLAHVGFRHLRLEEGGADLMLALRLHPRPEIAQIVRDRAVGDPADIARGRDRAKL